MRGRLVKALLALSLLAPCSQGEQGPVGPRGPRGACDEQSTRIEVYSVSGDTAAYCDPGDAVTGGACVGQWAGQPANDVNGEPSGWTCTAVGSTEAIAFCLHVEAE